MANLNFQQPPRSLASGSLGGRVGGTAVGFGVPSLSGHVTPTQGLFGGSFGGQALSPGRGATSSAGRAEGPPVMAGRTTLFGQRAFADRRTVMPSGLGAPTSNMMSNMGNFGRSSYGNSGYHSVFGGAGGDTSTPPLLDLSEFPSLTTRGQGDQAPAQNIPPPGTKPYVGMVKQPTSEQSEFTMSSEDFPALPGTSSRVSGSIGSGSVGSGSVGSEVRRGVAEKSVPSVPPTSTTTAPPYELNHAPIQLVADPIKDAVKLRTGIQTALDGKVSNIPSTMVANQFGIVGLLTFIRAAEADPNLVSLALGQDLTALGLNLNSPDNLYLTFAGPWADMPCRPQDIDYHVPPEYLINGSIREKLAPLKLNRYKDDLLFYLFYCFVGDVLQVAAAAELYNREWRYHMEEKVWITQAPGMNMLEKTSTYERGTYFFFDAHNWRKVAKEFHLDYSKLEGRPQLPV